MLNRAWLSIAVFSLLVLSGCASKGPSAPIPLNKQVLTNTSEKVGVALTAIPEPNTAFPGAWCLLCQGVAQMANQSMSAAVKLLPTEDLAKLKAELVAHLSKLGTQAVAIDTPIAPDTLPDNTLKGENLPVKDFRALKQQLGVGKLLLVEFTSLGVIRPYASYIPTGAPYPQIMGSASIINLSTNTYDWYEPIDEKITIQGEWDEAPKFPGLSGAYFELIERTKSGLLAKIKP